MSSTDDDPEKLAQALEHLETERTKRIEQRILSGEARLLPPLVVGIPGTAEPEPGTYRGFLREDGIIERMDFIATGVPRTARDVPLGEWHLRQPTEATQGPPPYREPGARLPQRGEPAQDGPWVDISTSIAGKVEGDPGRVLLGAYRHRAAGFLEVRGDDGKTLGTHPIKFGDDVEVFARKLLREAHTRGVGDFWDRPVR